ncbi:MAG: hypothetical protein HYV28_05875 [Ignavibacteriales bacterium]|nr:hypothetical protein [Ignavibacteriales bacterium]
MGFYCFGDKKPDKQKTTMMFELLESRGRDASGFAFLRDDNLIVHKAPIRSSIMTHSKEWKELELPSVFIAHTRMKTQGSEQNNKNNHPLYNKEGLCIVHNGMIHNDKEIFGKSKRDGEVDSEAILAVLSTKNKGDKIKRVFDKLEGCFAFACIDKNNPDTLILVKKDNPVELYYDSHDDILYFCSETDIMREALGIQKNTKRGFNIGEGAYNHYTMENNFCLIINKDGVESYKRYSPRREHWGYRDYYKGDELIIECPHCLGATIYHEGKIFNRCENCGSPLNEEDLYV